MVVGQGVGRRGERPRGAAAKCFARWARQARGESEGVAVAKPHAAWSAYSVDRAGVSNIDPSPDCRSGAKKRALLEWYGWGGGRFVEVRSQKSEVRGKGKGRGTG